MKKSNFVAMILGTIGTVFFALGMCMSLLPEWDMMRYCPYLILEAITQEQHNSKCRYRYKSFFTILRLKYLLSILILLYDI